MLPQSCRPKTRVRVTSRNGPSSWKMIADDNRRWCVSPLPLYSPSRNDHCFLELHASDSLVIARRSWLESTHETRVGHRRDDRALDADSGRTCTPGHENEPQ